MNPTRTPSKISMVDMKSTEGQRCTDQANRKSKFLSECEVTPKDSSSVASTI